MSSTGSNCLRINQETFFSLKTDCLRPFSVFFLHLGFQPEFVVCFLHEVCDDAPVSSTFIDLPELLFSSYFDSYTVLEYIKEKLLLLSFQRMRMSPFNLNSLSTGFQFNEFSLSKRILHKCELDLFLFLNFLFHFPLLNRSKSLP